MHSDKVNTVNYSLLQFLEIIEKKLREQLEFAFQESELEYQRILNLREDIHFLRITQTPSNGTGEPWVYTIRLKIIKTRTVDQAFDCLCTKLPGNDKMHFFFAVFHDTFRQQAEKTAQKIIVKISNEAFKEDGVEKSVEGGAGQDEIDMLMQKDQEVTPTEKKHSDDILEKVSQPFPLDSPESFFSSL